MKPTIMLDRKELAERLLDYLSEKEQQYINSQAYEILCDAMMDYFKSSGDSREEKHQVFLHAKDLFRHLCDTTEPPAPKQAHWDHKMQRHRFYQP
jgi:hypothetical protein